MKTKLDRYGRVGIPKQLRERLGLRPGARLEVTGDGQRIILKPQQQAPAIVLRDGVWVYTGPADGDLTDVVRRSREERIKRFWPRK